VPDVSTPTDADKESEHPDLRLQNEPRIAGRRVLLRATKLATPSAFPVEDLAQFAGKGFWLAGVSRLAAHEAAVMAGKNGRLLPK